jgi:hypothetical protein
VGSSISGGIGGAVSNAQTINDLGGPFVNTNAEAGAGESNSVDAFYSADRNGNPVVGVGGSVGVGAGGSTSKTVTVTTIHAF